jgi:hypothetical protein
LGYGVVGRGKLLNAPAPKRTTGVTGRATERMYRTALNARADRVLQRWLVALHFVRVMKRSRSARFSMLGRTRPLLPLMR